jgi:hypothetical protein
MKAIISGFERRGWRVEPVGTSEVSIIAISPDRKTLVHVVKRRDKGRYHYGIVLWSDYGRGEARVVRAGRVAAETIAMLHRIQGVQPGGVGAGG